MSKQFIGVDVGTYETKAVLVDENGVVLARADRPHKMDSPQPGWAEHDPEQVWWQGFVQTVRYLMTHPAANPNSIVAVGCSAIGPTVLPVDEQLNPLRAGILYGVDTRSAQQIEELNQRLGSEEVFKRSGNSLTTQSGGPKIMWIKENEPEVYQRAKYYLTAHSFIVARLTGEVTIDHATAGYYHPLYDSKNECWDITGCEDFISYDQLPRIGWSTEIAGVITKSASAETGLPVGIPVTFGAIDAPAEAVSSGVLSHGSLMLMYGSSTFMIQMLDRPIRDEILWSAPYVFPNTYALAAGTSTAGTLTHWVADIMSVGNRENPQQRFKQLLEIAAASPIGAKGLVTLPYFSGERTPHHDPDARGIIAGLNLTHTRSDLVRSILEGVACSVSDALLQYDSVQARPDSIHAVGGGTKNNILIQTVSDLTNHTQHIADTPGAAYGDTMLAALAIGYFNKISELSQWCTKRGSVTPIDKNQKILAEQYQVFHALYQSTAPLMHEMAKQDDHNI